MSSEGLLTDSAVAEGQPDSSPTAADSEEQQFNTLGYGAAETDEAGPEEASAEQTDEGAAEASANPSPDELTLEEYKAGYMRTQDYTRKTQDIAEDRRQFEAEQREWFAKQEARLEQQQQAQQETLSKLQQVQAPGAQTASLAQRINEAAANPNLSETDRAGLGVVGAMAQGQEELKAENEQLRQHLDQLVARFEQYEPQVQAAAQFQQQQTERQRQQLEADYVKGYQEAAELYGRERTLEAREFISRNIGAENKATGRPYTIPELVAWHARVDEQQRAEVQEANRQQQRAARSQATGATAAAAPPPQSGRLTREQAIAMM